MKILKNNIRAGITGFESPANEYIDSKLSLDELLISHVSATFIGRAQGNSMVGFGIFNNDLLIIDRAAATTHFDIVAATLNGEFICKAIDRKNRLLISASPEKSQYRISENDEYQEEGIVISSIRMHRAIRSDTLCLP